jgi:hypothetical protein
MYTVFAVALFAVTVKDSLPIVVLVDRYGVARSVVTPAASFGVIVKVAVSPAAIEPVVELNENEAGAPATVQVTVEEAESAPGPEASSEFPVLSVQML